MESKERKRKKLSIGSVEHLLSPFSLTKNMPYILLAFVLSVVYISNSNKATAIVREHSKKMNELKEERWRYRDLQSRLMYQTSEKLIIEKSQHLGLKPLEKPAFEIKK